MTSFGYGREVALHCSLLLLLAVAAVGTRAWNLQTLVESIAAFDNATELGGTDLCLYTTENSTLEEMAPTLLRQLLTSYPTSFLSTRFYVDTRVNRLATMVLIDATAFEQEFPWRFIRSALINHPCYQKTARFVILLSEYSFARKADINRMLGKLGILNYILVLPGPMTIYTSNWFTGREDYFRYETDRPSVGELFPDKLHNLNGYQFSVQGISDYPYLILFLGKPHGVITKFFKIIVGQYMNGTTHFTEDSSLGSIVDCRFNRRDDRRSFKHTMYFREPTGAFLMCPVRHERDFLQHLLRPFSVGIWVCLGALFLFCRALESLFPEVYPYDLIGLTFFGGGGAEHERRFPFRVVTLTLAVLVFFLAEAYNTKIISLMSFAKFYVQPQTLDELIESDFRILALVSSTEWFGPIRHSFLSLRESRREEKRLGLKVYEQYCALVSQGTAWTAVTITMREVQAELYIVPEPVTVDRLSFQFHQYSPFFELFVEYFNRFNDVGLWGNLVRRHMEMLQRFQTIRDPNDQFQEVIFFFDDLTCVWILLVAGWLVSAAGFVGELIWCRMSRRMRARRNWQLVRAAGPFSMST